ncbi:HET-domain-containing protein, partial [Mytilinidion resinicola]
VSTSSLAMRLLNVDTLRLEFFHSADEAPPYAILSHRWEDDEPASIRSHPHLRRALSKEIGWYKVEGACWAMKHLDMTYVWIDTLCIDKSSSAELSESINSMFSWYQKATLCFAYLSDLEPGIDQPSQDALWKYRPGKSLFEDSQWFKRGWTLQELIAPTEVWFFDRYWGYVGSRSSLAERIAQITNISSLVLTDPSHARLWSTSVAARLSWAAKRTTTRLEDRAYSLCGLFGVNMSTIYGEGEATAFFRLQTEIFQANPDHTIFAWD